MPADPTNLPPYGRRPPDPPRTPPAVIALYAVLLLALLALLAGAYLAFAGR